MKKTFSIVLLIFIIILTGCSKEKKVLKGIITEDDLKVRNSPSGKIIGRLSAGTKVVVLGRTQKKYKIGNWENYWYKVKLKNGTIGWCYAQWVKIVKKGQNSNQNFRRKENVKNYQYFLYVTNYKGKSLSIYKIDKTGNLTFKGLTRAISLANGVAAHPRKNLVYLIERSRLISYKIRNTGTLEPIGTIKRGAGSKCIKVHPNGRFVYVSSVNPIINIGMFRVQRDGRLKPMGDVFTYKMPRRFDIHPFGYAAYFFDKHKGNSILSFKVKTNGKLEKLEDIKLTGRGEGVIKVHPNGKLLFVYDNSLPQMKVFSVLQNGKIKPKTTFPLAGRVSDIQIAEDTDTVYVSLYHKNKIVGFKFKNNKYEKIAEYITGRNPKRMIIHPNNKRLYVTCQGEAKVYVYSVLNSGELNKAQTLNTGAMPYDLTIGKILKKQTQ